MNTDLPPRPWSLLATPGGSWRLCDANGDYINTTDPIVVTYLQACVAACDGFEPAELTPRMLRRLVDQLTDDHNQAMAAYLLTTPQGDAA